MRQDAAPGRNLRRRAQFVGAVLQHTAYGLRQSEAGLKVCPKVSCHFVGVPGRTVVSWVLLRHAAASGLSSHFLRLVAVILTLGCLGEGNEANAGEGLLRWAELGRGIPASGPCPAGWQAVSPLTRKMARSTSSLSPRRRLKRIAGWLVYLYVSMTRSLSWMSFCRAQASLWLI